METSLFTQHQSGASGQPEAVTLRGLEPVRPVVNFANRLQTAPDQVWDVRTIPDCQLLFVLSGSLTLELGPQRYRMEAGDCAFYGARSPHRIITETCLFCSIHFNWQQEPPTPVFPVDIQGGLLSDLKRDPVPYYVETPDRGVIRVPHLTNLPDLEPLILQIVREYRVGDWGCANVMNALLTQVLLMLLRHTWSESGSPDALRKVTPAIEAVRKDLRRPWTTGDLAALCGYHPTYFAALFAEATGIGPKHFVLEERIRKAKLLLPDVESVSEVAEAVGFAGVHYFCRQFKRLTGMTPSAYRQQRHAW